MIFQQFQGALLVVRQPDHGVQTGDLAQHWGNEHMPSFTPRTPVIDAGTRHDNGWAEWEQRPSLDPETGRPWQFFRLSPHEHVPLYRRGIREAADHDGYTGLLVSMHGAGLYNDRYGTFRLAEQRCTVRGEFALALDPYPFAESPHTFPVAARLLLDRRYHNAEDFLEAMTRVPGTVLECRVERG